MSVKKALKEGLKPQKESKTAKSDYSEKGSRDKAIKSFRKMSGSRGDMPL
jgi:hypothetical protein